MSDRPSNCVGQANAAALTQPESREGSLVSYEPDEISAEQNFFHDLGGESIDLIGRLAAPQFEAAGAGVDAVGADADQILGADAQLARVAADPGVVAVSATSRELGVAGLFSTSRFVRSLPTRAPREGRQHYVVAVLVPSKCPLFQHMVSCSCSGRLRWTIRP